MHHADYLNALDDHALCGVAFQNPTALTQVDTADALCPDCQARLVVYHLEWWRERALAATAELEELRAKYRELQERAGIQRPAPATAHIDEDSRVEDPAARAEAEPATFLDHARREIAALVAQFEEEIPFWRLKNTMQAFSDKLNTDERVLLAQELGASGSLIRWSTTEVEALGRSVANSPMQEQQSEAMWETWHQDSYQPPKRNKRRLGRPRRG